MIKIENIKNLNVNITWRLLYIALREELLITEDIIEYASDILMQGDDRLVICELAGADSTDSEYIKEKLFGLVEAENSENDYEERKIRAVIISEKLKEKNSNYINGLMELTELWVQFGYPEDSPHIIQGRGNNISPTEYYTQSNYDKLYIKNKEWLEKELSFLKNK